MKNIFLAIVLSLMVIGAFAHDPQPGTGLDTIAAVQGR
jgi:hypothetical protein